MQLDTSNFLAIVDDDKSVQSALQDLMESEGLSTRCFDSAEQFLESEEGQQASCLVADIGMPGISGLELQARLKVERCDMPIIFITAHGDVPSAVSAMREGACDFFTKPFDATRFLESVEHALERGQRARRKSLEHASLRARYCGLTPREQKVLELLVTGLLNKQVAAELGITEYTVQVHRGHIMRKMSAASFAALVTMVERLSQNS